MPTADRARNRSLFFDDLLDAKVREFNPRYAEAQGALLGQFRHLHTDIYGNREFVEHLRNRGKSFDREEKRVRNLIPIDYDGQEHILEQEDGKERWVQVVTELSRAFALCAASDEATGIRDDVSFFQTLQAALKKQSSQNRKTPEQIDAAIRQLVSKAIKKKSRASLSSLSPVRVSELGPQTTQISPIQTGWNGMRTGATVLRWRLLRQALLKSHGWSPP